MRWYGLSWGSFCGVGAVALAGLLGGEPTPAAAQQQGGASRAAAAPVAAAALPPDVDPESLNRLPRVRREDLDDFGKKLYDTVTADSRLLGLDGPIGIRMHSPRVSDYMNAGNRYLRFESGIEPRLMELAILVVAREMDSQFEWVAHEAPAIKAGLEQQIIDVVKHRRPLTGIGEKEAAVIQLGREAFGRRKVEPETFATALRHFGRQGIVNLVSLMGHYSATAMLLTTFDQQLRPGQQALLPIP
jgi:4-carboxymuconolactone decarboxylase